MGSNTIFNRAEDLLGALKDSLTFDGAAVGILDANSLREGGIDILIYNSLFASEDVKTLAREIITKAGKKLGAESKSIQTLYEAMGGGETSGYTVPAINIRTLTYDTARAIIRAAQKNNSGTFIFEIAKSEIGYTDQRPAEYSACIIAAAIKEGYKGPLFLQGDHFQANAAKYNEDIDKEMQSLKDLIKEGVDG